MNWFIDAHEDLAWNMACFQRDYSQSAYITRQKETGTQIPAFNGDTMLGWPEYHLARVAVIFGSLYATPARPIYQSSLDLQIFRTPEEAHKLYWKQLELYLQLCDQKPWAFRLIQTQADLQSHLANWQVDVDPIAQTPQKPVGIVPLMEGADAILSTGELPQWWQAGLRIIGLAWVGNRF
ncbi:MAG: hypothetical protein WA110_08910, partial [Anaerolineaceae bacterium]